MLGRQPVFLSVQAIIIRKKALKINQWDNCHINLCRRYYDTSSFILNSIHHQKGRLHVESFMHLSSVFKRVLDDGGFSKAELAVFSSAKVVWLESCSVGPFAFVFIHVKIVDHLTRGIVGAISAV